MEVLAIVVWTSLQSGFWVWESSQDDLTWSWWTTTTHAMGKQAPRFCETPTTDARKSSDARINMIWKDWSVHVLLSQAAGQILAKYGQLASISNQGKCMISTWITLEHITSPRWLIVYYPWYFMSKPKVGGRFADRASPHPSKGELRLPVRSGWNEVRENWCVEFWCVTFSMYQLPSTGRGWRGAKHCSRQVHYCK